MSMADTYCDVTLSAASPADMLQATGRFMHLLHGLLRAKPELTGRVGVGFPEWRPNEVERGRIVSPGSLGHVLRLVGPSEQVRQVAEDPTLLAFLGNGWNGRMGTPRPLPESASHVRFARDRRMERASTRYREREARRLQDRDAGKSRRNRDKKSVDRAETHRLLLPSKSTGQFIPLNIRRERVDEPAEGTFNSYGLSSTATIADF